MLTVMLDFFTIAVTFPALPFTVAVAASTAFWLFSLATGLDLGLEGADSAVEGVVADAAVEGAVDVEVEPGSAFDGLAFLATVFRIGKVPITLWLSLFTLWGWVVAFVGGWLLQSPLLVLLPAWPGNVGVMLIATVAGVVLAGVTSRPFEPFYRSHGGRKRASLVGEVAEITTSRVDDRFGQARIEVGSDDLVVQVRCDRKNPLTRGNRALVVEFDKGRDAFVVEPLEESKVLAPEIAARQPTREGLTE